jgi:tetratricopeptide (TPR) repeat protein
MFSRRRDALIARSLRNLPLLVGFLIAPVSAHHAEPARADADRRIALYQGKLAKDPNLYPVHAQLGWAYLDKAIGTFDPQYVVLARSSFERSLQIQATFDAYHGLQTLASYVHRFEESLRWGGLARESLPENTAVVAKLVEARLGLGEVERAAELLADPRLPEEDFHLAASRGHLALARGEVDAAVAHFERAAEQARVQKFPEPACWAQVRAAAARMESGRFDEASEHLKKAEEAKPRSVDLYLHRGRWHELQGQWVEALREYQQAMQISPVPEVHSRAAAAARRAGEMDESRKHFELAERGFRRVLDAGEIYSLGALARLYFETDTRLDEALALARNNLSHVRDRASQKIVNDIESRIQVNR